jgi:hypothetical protein
MPDREIVVVRLNAKLCDADCNEVRDVGERLRVNLSLNSTRSPVSTPFLFLCILFLRSHNDCHYAAGFCVSSHDQAEQISASRRVNAQSCSVEVDCSVDCSVSGRCQRGVGFFEGHRMSVVKLYTNLECVCIILFLEEEPVVVMCLLIVAAHEVPF